MRHLLTLGLTSIVCTLLLACANPADKAQKAIVSNVNSVTAATPATAGERLEITPQNSKITFTGSKVTGIENGSFEKFTGTIELVGSDVEKSRVSIEIDLNSITTESKGLSDHLKTADFFDVQKFPKATFTSTQIKAATGSNAYQITGILDLHGVKKAITFPAAIKVDPDSISVNSEFSINRKDFGIVYPGKANDLIRDEVVLKLAIKTPRARH